MKVWNYVMLSTTLVLVLAVAGISTGLDGILQLIGLSVTDGATGSASTFWDAIFASQGILLGLGAGIVIGAIKSSSPENYLILPLILGVLGLFIDTFVKVINYSKSFDTWIFGIVLIIFGPLMVGYALALVEFFRGTD